MKMRVLGGSIAVGDYITTDKPTDVWHKVEKITSERVSATVSIRVFHVVNKAGYRRQITDDPGLHRRFYRFTTVGNVI